MTNFSKTDWNHADAPTDAEIAQVVAGDPDTFIPDAAWLKNARIVMPQNKDIITLRLDHEVLAWFRRSGRGYQTRINAVLKAFVDRQRAGA